MSRLATRRRGRRARAALLSGLLAALAGAPVRAGPREWASPALIQAIDGADISEAVEILSGLALRQDPSIGACIEHFLGPGDPVAEQRAEYLLRVLLKDLFPDDAPEDLRARRAEENRTALEATAARLGAFSDLALRSKIVRLLPLLGDPAQAVAAEAADMAALLDRQDGRATPAQDAYILVLLDAMAAAGEPDLLPVALLLGRYSRTRPVVERAREVARSLALSPAASASGAP